MSAQNISDAPPTESRTGRLLAWLGGGDWNELAESHERSSYAITGVVVGLNAVIAGLVFTLALAQATTWPVVGILPVSAVFGVLIGAVIRAIAGGLSGGRLALLGRGVVALGVGVMVGELAALVIFSGSAHRHIDNQAALAANASPAVVQASTDLDQAQTARTALDDSVESARSARDKALVTARCEYNPSPGCPETRITGVPGTGPESRTANEILNDAQAELGTAITARNARAPELDAQIADDQQALAQARKMATADADRGLGARWVAMHEYTVHNAGALLLRLLTIAFCVLLSILPLVLRLWRGETTHDRNAAARAARDRAEIEAETAIALKRAEVRAEAEILWAEQQLANARAAAEAQTEIDRHQQRVRVAKEIGGPTVVASQRPTKPLELSQRTTKPVEDDMYLPIAAEAEAASKAVELPTGRQHDGAQLPATVEPGQPVAEVDRPVVPSIPDVTKAAARWIRPLLPPVVARAIDGAANPLRAARQAFEEVEEIAFTFKRTHKVTVDTEESANPPVQTSQPAAESHLATQQVESTFLTPTEHLQREYEPIETGDQRRPFGLAGRSRKSALRQRDLARQLNGPHGPRQLPPGE